MEDIIGGSISYILATPLVLGIIIGLVLQSPFHVFGVAFKVVVLTTVIITIFLLVREDGSQAVSPEYFSTEQNQEKALKILTKTATDIISKVITFLYEFDWSNPQKDVKEKLDAHSPQDIAGKITPFVKEATRVYGEAGKELVPSIQKVGKAARPWVIEARKKLVEEMERHKKHIEHYEG